MGIGLGIAISIAPDDAFLGWGEEMRDDGDERRDE